MKLLRIVMIVMIALLANQAHAQKFGFIETEKIVAKMPEYKEVQKELEKYANNWKKRLENMKQDVDKMKEAYKADEILLTPEMQRARKDSIFQKEEELISLQERIFGYEGALFRKRADLMKPIQDQIYKAVEKVCRKQRLQFMFDKSADLVMIYAREEHNYTDFVLEELGLGDPIDSVEGKD